AKSDQFDSGEKNIVKFDVETTMSIAETMDTFIAKVKEAYSGSDEDDINYFYYSGHSDSDGDDSEDSELSVNTLTDISSGQLKAILDRCPGTYIIVLDTCFSGAMASKNAGPDFANDFARTFRSGGSARGAFEDGSVNADKYKLLLSSSHYTSSYQNKKYGYHTLSTVLGAGQSYKNDSYNAYPADENNDKTVTLSEIYKWDRATNVTSNVRAYPEHDNTTFLSYFNNANAVGSMIKNVSTVWHEDTEKVDISFDAGNFDTLEKGILIEAQISLFVLCDTAGSPIDYSAFTTKPPKVELISVRPNERNTVTVPLNWDYLNKFGKMSVLIRPQAEGAATVLVPVACTGFDDSAPAKSQNVLSLVKPLKNEMFAPKADKRELRISMQLKDTPIIEPDTYFEALLSCYILDAGGNKVRTIADNLPGRLNAIWSNGASGKK
ncbi:MAG: caspase family protein, partial [Hydrogenoanaerobacterium sp.]